MEAIVAAIILGVSLAFMVSIATSAVRTQTAGEELQTAAALADEQLQMVVARGPDNYGQQFGLAGTCDAPFSRYRYELAISGGSDIQPYNVKVTIIWPITGGERRISVSTAIAARTGDDPDPVRQPESIISRPQ